MLLHFGNVHTLVGDRKALALTEHCVLSLVCKDCIMKYIKKSNTCPVCDTVIYSGGECNNASVPVYVLHRSCILSMI